MPHSWPLPTVTARTNNAPHALHAHQACRVNCHRRCALGFRVTLSIAVTVIGVVCTQGLEAQDSKITTNLGVGMTVPLNPTAQIVGSSINVVVGAGYNFNKYHSLVGQFMWA